MPKEITSLYLDDRLMKKAKLMKLNVSDMVNRILMVITEDTPLHEEELKLIILEDKRKTLFIRHKQIVQECEEQIAVSQTKIDFFDRKISEQQKVVKQVKEADKVASLIRSMNQKIIVADYEIEDAWNACAQEVKQMKELGHEIDKMWFVRHLKRLIR